MVLLSTNGVLQGLTWDGQSMHSSLERLVADIERAGRAGAWHAALALALSLPDICAKAAGRQVHYRDWFDRYVAPAFAVPGLPAVNAITGHDAYALRNAFLHAGCDDLSTYSRANDAFLSRLILTESSTVARTGVRKLRLPVEDVKTEFALPVGDLCEQVIRGVAQWSAEQAGDIEVQSRLDRILTIKPQSAGPTP